MFKGRKFQSGFHSLALPLLYLLLSILVFVKGLRHVTKHTETRRKSNWINEFLHIWTNILFSKLLTTRIENIYVYISHRKCETSDVHYYDKPIFVKTIHNFRQTSHFLDKKSILCIKKRFNVSDIPPQYYFWCYIFWGAKHLFIWELSCFPVYVTFIQVGSHWNENKKLCPQFTHKQQSQETTTSIYFITTVMHTTKKVHYEAQWTQCDNFYTEKTKHARANIHTYIHARTHTHTHSETLIFFCSITLSSKYALLEHIKPKYMNTCNLAFCSQIKTPCWIHQPRIGSEQSNPW